MERKLSAKATKIRHRLAFTRSSSARDLAPILVSPTGSSSSRPRSATNPESPTHEPTWDNSDPESNRGYSFKDEPGYFRPASPFIDRQEIEEDLEDDIKHACAMLSHSIDRGIPAGLSYPARKDEQEPAAQASVNADSSALKQNAILLSAPRPIEPKPESTKKHDSGVGMSFSSPSQPARQYDNSVPGKDTPARFYNKQPSTSPPHSPSPGLRSRSSLATTVEEYKSDRGYSSSLIPFPYNPPQLINGWTFEPTMPDSPISPINKGAKNPEPTESELKTTAHTNTNEIKPETSPPVIFSHETSSPGVDRTWLQTSRDIRRFIAGENATQNRQTKPLIRFYSSYNQTTGTFNAREWPTSNFWDGRDSSDYEDSLASPLSAERDTVSRPETGTPRLGSVSTNEDLSGGYPYQEFGTNGMSFSSSCLGDEFKHKERVYSVAMPIGWARDQEEGE
ncbi:unnamed protein product [Penicillium glandicola]